MLQHHFANPLNILKTLDPCMSSIPFREEIDDWVLNIKIIMPEISQVQSQIWNDERKKVSNPS